MLAPEEDPSDPPSLAELLVRSWEERERARREVEEEVWRGPTIEVPRPRLPIAGCLIRLVFLVLVLLALAVGGLFLLMSGSF